MRLVLRRVPHFPVPCREESKERRNARWHTTLPAKSCVLHLGSHRAETVHLLPDKLKTTSSDNDLTALVRVTAHQKSSLGGYDYDEIAFLPPQYGYQPGGSPV